MDHDSPGIDLAKDFAAFFNREMPGLVYKTNPISVG